LLSAVAGSCGSVELWRWSAGARVLFSDPQRPNLTGIVTLCVLLLFPGL